VGSALAYWLELTSPSRRGRWYFIDDDHVALHNTNRSMIMLPSDAGWYGRPPRRKAEVMAGAVACEPFAEKFQQWLERNLPYDLLLPLANGPDFRPLVSRRCESAMLHATTGRSWTTFLHRHLAGIDDCPECRLPGGIQSEFECSTGPAEASSTEPENDAALPFLSAAAGVLLVSSLYKLQLGTLQDDQFNLVELLFRSHRGYTRRSRAQCSSQCTNLPSQDVLEKVLKDRRWAFV
jgi:hypothetical protein